MNDNNTAENAPVSQKMSHGRMPFDSMFSRGIFSHLIPTLSANQPVDDHSESTTGSAVAHRGVELNFSHSFAA